MAATVRPDGNVLLAKIVGISGVAELVPQLERVKLKAGQVLHEPGASLAHVYFPVSALLSLVRVMRSGQTAEMAIIGNDGMVGAELMVGDDARQTHAVVQSAGYAYRLSTEIFSRELERSQITQRIVLAYERSLMFQTTQAAACNRLHVLSQKICCWLLLSLDRLPGNELRMTQETLANLLGVRRESVTLVASRLRDQGALDYRRGSIQVLDRAKIEAASCECYGTVHRECERLNSELPRFRIDFSSVTQRTDKTRGGRQNRATNSVDDSGHGETFVTERSDAAGGDRRRFVDRRLAPDRRLRDISITFDDRRSGIDERLAPITRIRSTR